MLARSREWSDSDLALLLLSRRQVLAEVFGADTTQTPDVYRCDGYRSVCSHYDLDSVEESSTSVIGNESDRKGSDVNISFGSVKGTS